MTKRTLNDRVLKALKPAKAGKRYDIMDASLPGFGVRVTDKGTKTFTLTKRFPGSDNPTRRALGEYPAIGLAEAREKARKWIDLIDRKIDPQVEVERQRLAEQRKRANSFAAVAEDFIKNKLPNERRGAEVERDVRREFIPVWGKRPIIEITALDVVNVIRPIARRAPYQAHNCLGHIRRLFGWAIDQHAYGIESSPVDRLKPRSIIGEKQPRSRILSDDELRAFWRATGRMGYPYGSIGRLLLLCGQRHHEVSEVPWSEVDLGKATWTIDQARFKSSFTHTVPLTPDMLSILGRLPRFKRGEFVFSTTAGEKPTVISDKIKEKIDARMLHMLRAMARMRGEDPSKVELRPWVMHDLRRTVRSHLSALRIPDHVAEMVIGHGRKGLQRVYDQHRYQIEMREALTLWAARLRDIVEPPPANVVEISRARA
jgi:integrase